MSDQPTPCACPTPPLHAATCPATADLWPGVAPSGSEADPLAPFRALADHYARAAAASLRNAEASTIDAARLTREAIAEGLTTAEYLLRATIDAADNSPATDGDDHA